MKTSLVLSIVSGLMAVGCAATGEILAAMGWASASISQFTIAVLRIQLGEKGWR